MQSAKINITKVVSEYKKQYPEEYNQVVEAIQMRRKMFEDGYIDEESLDVHDPNNFRRALYEIPLTLMTSITQNLTDDQLTWLKSGTPSNRNAGGRWFAKTFQEFALIEANKI